MNGVSKTSLAIIGAISLIVGLTGCQKNEAPSSSPAATHSSPVASATSSPANASVAPQEQSAATPSPSSPEPEATETLGEILETGARKAAAEKLLAEFRKHDDKMQNAEGTSVDWVLAIDNAKGLERFRLKPELADEIRRLKESYLEDVDYSTVYSGYTDSGVHVVALVQPMSDSSEVYKDTMNQVRETDKEWEYLSAFAEPEDMRAEIYYAVDLKVEGLVEPLSSYDFRVELTGHGNPIGLIEDPASYGLFTDIAGKYGRTIVDPGEPMKDGEWRTFLFDTATDEPVIQTTVNGEELTLTH